jgi:hypothetical protein
MLQISYERHKMQTPHQRPPRLATSSKNPSKNVLSTGLFPSTADLFCTALNPPALARPDALSPLCPLDTGYDVGGTAMLGTAESPILEILLRDAKSAGLTA